MIHQNRESKQKLEAQRCKAMSLVGMDHHKVGILGHGKEYVT